METEVRAESPKRSDIPSERPECDGIEVDISQALYMLFDYTAFINARRPFGSTSCAEGDLLSTKPRINLVHYTVSEPSRKGYGVVQYDPLLSGRSYDDSIALAYTGIISEDIEYARIVHEFGSYNVSCATSVEKIINQILDEIIIEFIERAKQDNCTPDEWNVPTRYFIHDIICKNMTQHFTTKGLETLHSALCVSLHDNYKYDVPAQIEGVDIPVRSIHRRLITGINLREKIQMHLRIGLYTRSLEPML